MATYDFVHLALLALDGEIQGKTKLQKTMYFLGLLTGQIDDLGYRPHYYGPYSAEVAQAVERLKTVRFIDQDIRGGSAVDQSGFEVCRYDYRLNEDGRKVAKEKKARNTNLWNSIQNAVKKFRDAGDLDYMKLSIAAKAFFLLDKAPGDTATEQELALMAKRFGWQVTPDQLREAAGFLKRLGLVTC